MNKQIIPSSPKLFIGLDIHKQSWKFHFATDILIGFRHSLPPCNKTLKNWLDKNYQHALAQNIKNILLDTAY